jgi:hypothetical protein
MTANDSRPVVKLGVQHASAIEAAHSTQERNGAAGVTLSMRAVLDAEDRLVWGSLDGVPPSFLPPDLRP